MNRPFKKYSGFLSKYLKPLKWKIAILTLLLGINIALQLISPRIIRFFIDGAQKNAAPQKLIYAAILFMGAAILQQIIILLSTYVSQKVGWRATNSLREDLIEKVLGLDMDFHKSHQPGELIERVDGDVTNLFNYFSKLFINLLSNGVLLLGILVLLFLEDIRIGLALTIFVAATIFILCKMQMKAISAWDVEREADAKMYGFLGEGLTAIEDIRSNGAVSYIMYGFQKQLQKIYPIRVKANMRGYSMWMITDGMFALGIAASLGVGGYLWKTGVITIGTVYLVFDYTRRLEGPIRQIRAQLEDLQKAGASIKRVNELLGLESKLIDGRGSKLEEGPISVSVKDISFNYDSDAPVLKDVSLSLDKGKILGVLGRTGSGKTTLARLIVRLYDIDNGELCLNGRGIKSIPLESLRKKVAYVTQDVQLFHATVRDNITFFNRNIKDETILNTINEVGLGKWYESLKDGLDTMIEAGGGNLSSGEAQLLAFVRVFLKNPGLVILDEASSRLDPITEGLIEKAMSKLVENRTCIIIAHRLHTIHRADDILILDDGSIIEYGDRCELVEDKDSNFYRLLQTGIEEVLV